MLSVPFIAEFSFPTPNNSKIDYYLKESEASVNQYYKNIEKYKPGVAHHFLVNSDLNLIPMCHLVGFTQRISC